MSAPAPANYTASPPPPATSNTTNTNSSHGPPILPLPPGPDGNLPTSTLIGLIVGIGLGGILVLAAVSLFFILRRRKQQRLSFLPDKADSHSGTPQNWQYNAPSPTNKFGILQKASTPPRGLVPPSVHGYEKPLSSPSPSLGMTHCTFTYEELEMATDGFSSAKLLGQGGFGYVHKGVLPNGKVVAVKQLKVGSGQGEREFQAEVETISRVHHRHLVSLVGYCTSGADRMLVYEFVPNNTLEFHLLGKGRPTMSWPTRMRIALGSAKGLAYLHEDCQPKIIHRDIKASNILLDMNFEAKVADFGLAKFYMDNDTHVSTRIMGTIGYLAPEYASSGKLTEKSDVFSFGVILLEFITGRRPVDTTHSFIEDSMVDWARPLLAEALETGTFDAIVDPKLKNDYSSDEMTRMVAAAAASVRHSARLRPRMSQIVRALEGNLSLDQLHDGIIPGSSAAFSPGSLERDSQFKEEVMKLKNMMSDTQEQGSGSRSTSDPDQTHSSSSDPQQTTHNIEMGLRKKDAQESQLMNEKAHIVVLDD